MNKYPITKKEFIEKCRFEVYTGINIKVNTLFFDWNNGYKFAIYCRSNVKRKNELITLFMDWIFLGDGLPLCINWKLAETDKDRFKVPISLSGW